MMAPAGGKFLCNSYIARPRVAKATERATIAAAAKAKHLQQIPPAGAARGLAHGRIALSAHRYSRVLSTLAFCMGVQPK